MSRWDWKELCGRGENISTWIQSDFGFCFEQLAIVCPTHCVLAIVGAFYLAHGSRCSQSYLTCRWRWNTKGRFGLCLLLMLAPLLRLTLQTLVGKREISIADGSICGVTIFAWILQSVFQWRLKYLYWMSTRGPVALNMAVLLTTITSAIQVRTVALQRIEHSILHHPSEEIITYIILGFEVLFLVTLIPASPQTYSPVSNNNAHVQEESDRLLGSSRTVRGYGAVKLVTKDLGVAESANCLSKLTFHWITPLLVKGAKKLIENADDLFTLPSRLNTHKIHLKFRSVLQGRDQLRTHTDLSNSYDKNVVNSDIGSTDSDPGVPHVQVQNPLQHNTSRNGKSRTLLSALNKAFGWEYYLLGVLKLLADSLGFAGPLLLNLLVTYIGDKNEKESNGWIYAGGLFVSTFLAMFFTTQFDYNVQVVGFKIRAAIITTIYHKALAVNSVSASKFTTGEIVNFMSTDTDRIVNFCPSFHAFWSLPFQIGVSLYLLHQQVGVAFLAGLCFAVILVPVNKWLANKIGDLSTKMMTQKDARVKVRQTF